MAVTRMGKGRMKGMMQGVRMKTWMKVVGRRLVGRTLMWQVVIRQLARSRS
jgi:hypothetical protein